MDYGTDPISSFVPSVHQYWDGPRSAAYSMVHVYLFPNFVKVKKILKKKKKESVFIGIQ